MVSDDYDILVRTFLSTKYVAIPDLLYIQYRNENGDNSTFLRNNQIQILVGELYRYYCPRINTKLHELGLPDSVSYSRVWKRSSDDPARKSAHITLEDSSKVSILFPIPYFGSEKDHSQLFETLQKGRENNFNEVEVVVVGNIPTEIEAVCKRWHRWERLDGGEMEPTRYIGSMIQMQSIALHVKKKVIVLP